MSGKDMRSSGGLGKWLRRIGAVLLGVFVIAAIWIFLATRLPGALFPRAEEGGAFLIRNVRVLAMEPGRDAYEEGWAVLVEDGRIALAAPEAAITVPAGTRTIDGGGNVLMPGLIDAHVHIWDEVELGAFLSHGVTTVRNASGLPLHLRLEQDIAEGRILGPRIISTGPIINSPGANQQDNHKLVATAKEAREAVAKQYADGYRHIKIYSNLQRDAYNALINEASSLGMTVMGHTPEGVRGPGVPFEKPFDIPFEDSLGRGLVTIEHLESIVWHGLYDDLDEDKLRALAKKIVASGDVVDPTLYIHRNLKLLADTDGAILEEPEMAMLNPFLRYLSKGGYEFWAGQPAGTRGEFDAFYLRGVKIFHEEGVPMVAGTDGGILVSAPGSSLTRELEMMVEAGLTPIEALTLSITNGAKTFGLSEDVGRIAPGYRAEFILVTGDPLADISAVEHPVGMAIGGWWLNKERLSELHETAKQGNFLRSAWHSLYGLWSM